MGLSEAEEQLFSVGPYQYFLGEPLEGSVKVAACLSQTTLPKLDVLIAQSDDPIFDELSRASVEIALERLPSDARMSRDSLQAFFGYSAARSGEIWKRT